MNSIQLLRTPTRSSSSTDAAIIPTPPLHPIDVHGPPATISDAAAVGAATLHTYAARGTKGSTDGAPSLRE